MGQQGDVAAGEVGSRQESSYSTVYEQSGARGGGTRWAILPDVS
jgi:hypothetical protein